MFKVKKGFTVIEIAIVIAVVAVIAGVWYVSKNKAGADSVKTHDLSLTNFSVSPNPVKRGQTVTFTSTVKNIGSAAGYVVITYTSAQGETIGTPQTITVIKPGKEKTISKKHKIKKIAKLETYTVNATVSSVIGEQNTQDNSKSTQVKVTK